MRNLWTSRFARRLTIAFVVTAVAAAALTTLLVNLAIGARFEAYLDSQRQAREQPRRRVPAGRRMAARVAEPAGAGLRHVRRQS